MEYNWKRRYRDALRDIEAELLYQSRRRHSFSRFRSAGYESIRGDSSTRTLFSGDIDFGEKNECTSITPYSQFRNRSEKTLRIAIPQSFTDPFRTISPEHLYNRDERNSREIFSDVFLCDTRFEDSSSQKEALEEKESLEDVETCPANENVVRRNSNTQTNSEEIQRTRMLVTVLQQKIERIKNILNDQEEFYQIYFDNVRIP